MKENQDVDNTNILSEEQKAEILVMLNRLKKNATVADFLKEVHLKYVWRTSIPQKFFIFTTFAAIVSFLYFISPDHWFCFKNVCVANNKIPIFDFLLYSFWAIAPPLFFLYEYLKIFPYKLDQAQFNDLKYTHELSTKIWAALLFIFGVILYSKYGVR